jgi:hypothetical protein
MILLCKKKLLNVLDSAAHEIWLNGENLDPAHVADEFYDGEDWN